jgi:uncharacterized protein
LSDCGQIGILQGRETSSRVEMGIADLLKFKRPEILRLAQAHGAHNVRIFGSVARGEARPESDVDFLVEMDSGRSLLDLIELSQDLETLLQRKVDILTDQGLSPYLEQRIHAEAVPL